jgi:hypothetical protein
MLMLAFSCCYRCNENNFTLEYVISHTAREEGEGDDEEMDDDADVVLL